jgi:hypothetical protein
VIIGYNPRCNEAESRDPAGELAVQQLAAALRARGDRFTDPHFPPNAESLWRGGGGHGGNGGKTRAQSRCRLLPPLIHFILDSVR